MPGNAAPNSAPDRFTPWTFLSVLASAGAGAGDGTGPLPTAVVAGEGVGAGVGSGAVAEDDDAGVGPDEDDGAADGDEGAADAELEGGDAEGSDAKLDPFVGSVVAEEHAAIVWSAIAQDTISEVRDRRVERVMSEPPGNEGTSGVPRRSAQSTDR